VLTAGATFLLILAGGLVTNTGAGLAVPDWPTTFGHNMFLYPWSKMVGGVFYEHSHRLIGSVVGLLTLALTLSLWLGEPRRWLRWLGALALGAVILQGVLGGLRVILVQDTLAIVHGVLAQAFFGLTASLALFTSREWNVEPRALHGEAAGPLFRWCALTTAAISLQILFGALLTHVGKRLDAHLVLATLIALVVPNLAARVRARHADRGELVRPVVLLCGLLILQLLVGLGAYAARFTSLPLPLPSILALALPVSHRLVGGLLLVTSLLLTLRAYRLRSWARPAESGRSLPERVPA
jgi:cytochrome c oxidase assembly protein subunit 15